ncbi:hypothetical protein RUND412_004350, partial [Rhizina undulata]
EENIIVGLGGLGTKNSIVGLGGVGNFGILFTKAPGASQVVAIAHRKNKAKGA